MLLIVDGAKKVAKLIATKECDIETDNIAQNKTITLIKKKKL